MCSIAIEMVFIKGSPNVMIIQWSQQPAFLITDRQPSDFVLSRPNGEFQVLLRRVTFWHVFKFMSVSMIDRRIQHVNDVNVMFHILSVCLVWNQSI